jgi:hypothetical protein
MMCRAVGGRVMTARFARGRSNRFCSARHLRSIMAMTAKWRSFLIVVLVLGVSPFSSCAQIVCSISCSHHGARNSSAPGDPESPERKDSVGAGNAPRTSPCQDEAESHAPDSGAFRNRKGVCHKSHCALSEVAAAKPFTKSRRSTVTTSIIGARPTSAAAIINSPLTRSQRRFSPPLGFSETLALSGILRI